MSRMNRRSFAKSSFLAATAAALPGGLAFSEQSRMPASIPGFIPTSASEKAQFPGDFLWGMATSSYQVEGAWIEDG